MLTGALALLVTTLETLPAPADTSATTGETDRRTGPANRTGELDRRTRPANTTGTETLRPLGRQRQPLFHRPWG
jgi:hypothetical protein